MSRKDMPAFCLRPDFTAVLAERLSAGASLMLTSPHGQGRRRTLFDLRRCLPASIRLLQANLRDCPESCAALLATLSEQSGLQAPESMDALLAQLTADRQPTLIILHNFDELQPGKRSGFDDHFFAALDAVHLHQGLSLLCVCEQRPDWPLAIDTLPLPPLTHEQIATELARRGIDQGERTRLAGRLVDEPAPYSAIEAAAPESGR